MKYLQGSVLWLALCWASFLAFKAIADVPALDQQDKARLSTSTATLWSTTVAQPVAVLTVPYGTDVLVEVCCGKDYLPLVIMYRDGRVEIDPETEPDYAAEVFWEAVARQIP